MTNNKELNYFVELLGDPIASQSLHLMQLYMYSKFDKNFSRLELIALYKLYEQSYEQLSEIIAQEQNDG